MMANSVVRRQMNSADSRKSAAIRQTLATVDLSPTTAAGESNAKV